MLLCLLLTFSLSAQTGVYNALTIPKELTEHANEVVRLDYMNFVIDSPKSATLHVKYVVTLLNDKSDAAEQYVSYEQHTKITSLSAKVYDVMEKEVRKVKSKEFVDRSAISNFSIYDDDPVKSIEVKENIISYTRLLEIYAVELPAERYNELRDFYKEIAKADGMKAVLVKRRP